MLSMGQSLVALYRLSCRFVGLLCLVLLFGCHSDKPLQFQGQTMGTVWHVTLSRPQAKTDSTELRQGIQTTLDRVEALMSTYRPDSELSRFNASDPGPWFAVAPETAIVASAAIEAWRLTEGAFDVTVAPLVDLWGFGPIAVPKNQAPSPAAIAQALTTVGTAALEVRRTPPALRKLARRRVDLSAIAKGFAVDQVARFLEGNGAANFLVEVGGELRTRGLNPTGHLWRVGIETPELGGGAPIEAIRISDKAVATSGDYRNFRVVDGQRVSHTIDPRTGRPINHSLASVTVVADNAMLADALATGLTVMGADAALEAAESKGWAVYLVEREEGEFRVRHSRAFKSYLKKLSNEPR